MLGKQVPQFVNHTPLVSVVMSVYNDSQYVQLAIDSVLKQTFQNFEFIIIDDGSTDRTLEILKRYTSYPRIRLVAQENMGLTRSLNKGIELARGKYIARQDADDISLPMRFEKQIVFLENDLDCGLVGSLVNVIDHEGQFIDKLNLPSKDSAIRQALPVRNCIIHGAAMIRRTSIETVRGYRNEFFLAQDYDLWLRIAEHFKIGNIPQVMYYYRRSLNSISIQLSSLQKKYINIARELHKERVAKGSDIIMREGTIGFKHKYNL